MSKLSTSYLLELLKVSRKNILKIHDGLSIEQLNLIPEGFNNNLIWNFGHVIATQQILCYSLSGNKAFVSNDIIEAYRKGTKPEGNINQEAYNELITLSEMSISQMEKDVDTGVFKDYKAYTTSFGMTLSNIDEAIVFNNSHEAMHLGFSIALRKAVANL